MMITRDALLSDSAAIARLSTQLGYFADEATIAARIARLANRPDQLVIVTVLEERIVGWLQASTSDVLESGFRVEIVGLVVGEDCRRKGVGRRLVQRAEQWAVEIGADELVVRSNTKRAESHVFYPALGFGASKTQVVYRKALKRVPIRQADPSLDSGKANA
jgi:GNAT superfamily N-acetyltransferase